MIMNRCITTLGMRVNYVLFLLSRQKEKKSQFIKLSQWCVYPVYPHFSQVSIIYTHDGSFSPKLLTMERVIHLSHTSQSLKLEQTFNFLYIILGQLIQTSHQATHSLLISGSQKPKQQLQGREETGPGRTPGERGCGSWKHGKCVQ